MDWVKIGVIVTGIGLTLTWIKYLSDNEYKRSEFYLDQIKGYFQNAVELITNLKPENNNIQWHNAINSLKIAIELSKELTEKAHKHIYVMNYIDMGYKILNKIQAIKSYEFFYGISDWENDPDLTKETIKKIENDSANFLKTTTRISPESLLFLGKTLIKLDAHHSVLCSWEERFESFSQVIPEEEFKESDLSAEIYKTIKDYCSKWQSLKNKKQNFTVNINGPA